ncbi:unnamed protein product [Colias eurytheme]|nr:unnamed protein product [Colias eurytheme]
MSIIHIEASQIYKKVVKEIQKGQEDMQSLVYDVRAASNLNSRRLRDASAASAAPDLMNREGVWGRPQGVARGRSDDHRILRADK